MNIARQRLVHVVYNPVAGGLRRRPARFREVLSELGKHWPELEAVPTEGPNTAAAVVRRCIAQDSGLILVAGGDGTINEALAGIAGSSVPLGILPFGSANVLACELGFGNNPLRTASMLPSCTPVPVPLGRMTGADGTRLFACMAGAGFDAHIVGLVDPGIKRRLGKFAYWIYAFRQVNVRLPLFRVRVSGREYVSSFALISRVRNYGGDLAIARHANLLEDRFAIVLFSGENTLCYLRHFAGVLLDRLEKMKGVHVLDATSAEVEPLGGLPLDLQVDGEYAGAGAARYDILDAGVRLLIPAPYLSVMTPATVRLQYESL